MYSFERLGPDDDVVHEGRHSLVKGIPKDVVDHTLESCWYIAESGCHDSVFEKAISVTECRLPFVSLLYPDEVVAVLEVDFIEVFRSSNSRLELIHAREGVTILDSDLVDCSIVNVQM